MAGVPFRRRIKWTLFAAQAFGSAGFLVSSTVTPIVGASLSGHPAWAGVPAAFYWGGGACFAFVWGRMMDRIGRRKTIAMGLGIGMTGALIASTAVAASTFAGFVGGLVLMGAANTAVQLARFVAAEVHPKAERGRAIATVVWGGTIGGVLGPLLVAPTSRIAESLAFPRLAGPYAASGAFFLVGGLMILALLRPEPKDLALAINLAEPTPGLAPGTARAVREILRDRGVQVAMLSMLLAQGVMSTLMVISPLHMMGHQHSLGNISAVMSSHVIGMFAFSIVTGKLADAWGRGPLIAVGAMILVVAGIGATQSVALGPMSLVLFLLGLGWNLCYVGGSTLLSDRLSQRERARIQGLNDALLTGASALGSLLSGLAFGHLGYPFIGLTVAAIAVVPLSLGWHLTTSRMEAPAT